MAPDRKNYASANKTSWLWSVTTSAVATANAKKVYFFAIGTLQKQDEVYLVFLDRPLRQRMYARADENSFDYFGGFPKHHCLWSGQGHVLVHPWKQRKPLFWHNDFRSYTVQRTFRRHFCRKADSRDKGKVENVIGYVERKTFSYTASYRRSGNFQCAIPCMAHTNRQ